ncbi:SGNH/GDSL hydrolase family protein [Gammaproteobacteria bacterium]|nr:SGNH/GDSL hydrolase family protein [Gammaproteobacteria bacterium]
MHTREFFLGSVLFLASTLLLVGLFEVVFRIGLFSDSLAIKQLRQPWRFADSSYDDDYWKLSFLFAAGKEAQRVGFIDPDLGWAPKQSPENPLGLVSDTPYLTEDIHRPILFYGDSFVAGASPIPDRIPQQLDRVVQDRSVLNYGVGGYGVDQIYLRYLKTAGQFQDPIVLVGILTSDLDRTILKIRTGQKPLLEFRDGEMIVDNLPILASTRGYIEKNPPEISSYFLRFVMFRLRPWIPDIWFDSWYGYKQKHQRKLGVNHRILQALKIDAENRNIVLRVVIFYSKKELAEEGWREEFLKKTLNDLDIPYFDTKQHLLDYTQKETLHLDDLYYQANGHPNPKGNEVIANGIAEWLSH